MLITVYNFAKIKLKTFLLAPPAVKVYLISIAKLCIIQLFTKNHAPKTITAFGMETTRVHTW